MTSQAPEIKLLAPYRKLDNKNRYTVVTGGRGSAKSFHVSLRLLFMTYMPNEVILFTRYTLRAAEISIIPEFREKIEMMGLLPHFDITQDEVVNRTTGSKIIFRGIKTSSGNQTANLKSITGLSCWVLDEAEELVDENIFDTISNSVRAKGRSNKIYIVMNPSHTQHWVYKKFFKNGDYPNTTYIHTTYLQNLGNLDDSFINDAKHLKDADPKKYAHKLLGEWEGTDDKVFPNGYKTYEEEPTDFDWEILGGDFGYSTGNTAVVRLRKKGNDLYIRQFIFQKGMSLSSISKELEKLGLIDVRSVWDSADKSKIVDLRLLDADAVAAKKGFVFVRLEKIKRFNVLVHIDSKQVQEEMDEAVWEKDSNGEYKRNSYDHLIMYEDSPKKDDCLDAIGYALSYFYDMTGL